MTHTKHTPEPWKSQETGLSQFDVIKITSDVQIDLGFIAAVGWSYQEHRERTKVAVGEHTERALDLLEFYVKRDQANARRIVACVNGCEGINPEAVKELLGSLKVLADILHLTLGWVDPKSQDQWRVHYLRAKTTIAKAEGP